MATCDRRRTPTVAAPLDGVHTDAPGADGVASAVGAVVPGGRSLAERIAIGTELFIAGLAYAAGLGMLADPEHGLGFPPGMIDGVWFVHTWAVPGFALIAVNGIWPTAVAVAAIRHHPLAPLGHLLIPVTTAAWIGLQVTMIGWWPVLQIGTVALGVVAGVAGWIAARQHGGGRTAIWDPARRHSSRTKGFPGRCCAPVALTSCPNASM